MDWQSALHCPELVQSGLFINGQWLKDGRNTFPVYNPANNQIIAHMAQAESFDLEQAVQSSQEALQSWQLTPPKERANLLRKWYQLILAHADDLATILTIEQGKPLAEAKSEIVYGASYLEFFSDEATRIHGEIIPADSNNFQLQVIQQSLGVCAAITPWNFPNAMLARKLAPALAAGCTMIVKPAGQTPLSASAMAYLASQAGIPQGVFNLVNAPDEEAATIGKFLCNNFAIRKISFTGSTKVGVWLYQNAAPTMKKLALELGGNAPLIVFADADIETAVAGIMACKFRNAGQTCVCANRILVHNSLKPVLIKRLLSEIAALQIGDGLQPGCQIGPLINAQAITHLHELVADALNKQAVIHCGGHALAEIGELFFAPTLIECSNTAVRLYTEEIFGPILAIYGFTSEAEALQMANDTPYGLASYLFSTNTKFAEKFASQLEYGMVGINTGLISRANAPFGGVKMSGLGREGSQHNLAEYLNLKYICIQAE